VVKLIVLKKKENTENIVSKNESKIEFIDTSYDTDEIKVAELIKNGFTIQQATSWLRKRHIDKMFNKLGG
jgi:peptide methionine sulfoxide reductase MsrA